MFDELITWWQELTPEMQTAIQDGGLAVGALLCGLILGAMVARGLRARNFDAALRLPGSSPPGPEVEQGFTPTWVAGLLVRLTVWAVAAWWRAVRRVVRYGIPFQKEVVEPSDTWVHRLTESRKADRDHSRSVKTGTGRPV